jgi:hypothetical protein
MAATDPRFEPRQQFETAQIPIQLVSEFRQIYLGEIALPGPRGTSPFAFRTQPIDGNGRTATRSDLREIAVYLVG